MRPPNAIDFWRGVALVMIFVNHVPGLDYSILTLRNYAISDAAELFVFLAGCSLAFVANGTRVRPVGQVVFRLLMRAFEIWQAQIVSISVAIAMLGASAIAFTDPLLLEWHNAGPAFSDTVRASIGMVLLTYQIGYFNILPLYVALLLLSVVFVVIARYSLTLTLAASLALYVATLTYEIQFPSWPASGAWFFNPLSWQLLIVLGFLAIAAKRKFPDWERWVMRGWPLAVAIVCIGTAIVWVDYRPDPLLVPEPRYFFLFDKAYLSPARILSMLAIAIAFYPAFPLLSRQLGPVVRYCSSLGRNSLAVFCVASLLALAGQIVRYIYGPSFVLDTAIVASGLLLLRFTAWVAEYQASES
ncbi:OpgC family protein [Hyphomicrobium sp.]|uniref:OpgC family protein n=1 Tax=Hyphomicrobium sp. TaxID=82 RepID=UPI002E37938C|nr:OpgC domain-containing protein [Hyphomicrobium sp.]HEX2839990.1 OpgC domain-containing protein [Hyphomicrobium sp.]